MPNHENRADDPILGLIDETIDDYRRHDAVNGTGTDADAGADTGAHDEADEIARGVECLEAVERESHRLLRQADRLVRALAARSGLDPDAFRCLHLLGRHGTLPSRRLSALTGLDPDQTRAALAALESAALARRVRDDDGHVVVEADPAACRARVDAAVRELRESWYPLTARRCDDLAIVATLLADGRRLSELVLSLG